MISFVQMLRDNMPEPGSRIIGPTAALAPTTSSTSAMLVQRLMPLDLGEELQALLHPTNRLIYSPHTIAADLLQPFHQKTKPLILVNAQNGKSLPVTLQALHSSYLIVDTQYSMFRRKPGEAMLVVFPLALQQHCVLQTTIHKVYAFRLELGYQDPRYDVRHAIPLSSPVTLSPVPTPIVTALEQNQGRLVRQIAVTSGTSHGAMQRLITDLFYLQNIPTPAWPHSSKRTLFPCTLYDISLGGACLAVSNPQLVDTLMHRLVHLTLSLPYTAQTLPDWTYTSLKLDVLGIVRDSSNVTAPKALHIRFLKRLLPEVDTLFWHLENSLSEESETQT